jgi:DNA-directed RNA polymerase subunit RPC12/RpoP
MNERQKARERQKDELAFSSSRGLGIRCPRCTHTHLELNMSRDGSQVYWCHRCESGWRIGDIPREAIYSRLTVAGTPLEPTDAAQAAQELSERVS